MAAEAWLSEAELAEAGESETAALEADSALTGVALLVDTAALLLDAEVESLAVELASCCTTCSVLADASDSAVAACAVVPLPK